MGDLTPITHYGEKFQFGRKLMKEALSARAVTKWEKRIAEESHTMFRLVQSNPKDFVAHLNRSDVCIHIFTLVLTANIGWQDPLS